MPSLVTSVERVALYAGSFDPVTHGHEDLIQRTFTFADRLVVAVANNVAKQPLFTFEERAAFIRAAVGEDRRIESDRGSIFLMCKLSFEDSRFVKYPRLPVVICSGYRPETENPPVPGG